MGINGSRAGSQTKDIWKSDTVEAYSFCCGGKNVVYYRGNL